MRIVSRSNALDYKKGFYLAMDYIEKHNCNTKITDNEINSWIKLQGFIKNQKEK